MLTEVFSKLRAVGWFLPGFLLWAAFPPFAEKTDVLFALAPLMWLSRRAEAKTSAKRWAQSGIFFWIATLSWMPAIVKNGGPWPLVALGWIALAAYCTLYFTAYGYLSATYWRQIDVIESPLGHGLARIAGILLVEPILWCGLELVRSRLFGGFAWNQLGVVPINGGFASPAAVGGVYLCSAVVILINGTIAGIIERVVDSLKKQPVKRMRSLETVIAFLIVWGIYQLPPKAEETNSAERQMKVALVQRNFPCCFQAREESPYAIYERLIGNIAPLAPDVVVLPESAMCEFGPIDQQGAMRFAEWLSKQCGGAAVIAGGTHFREGLTYNSAAMYAGGKIAIYDKVHLVPFGEFIPGDKLFPWLQRLAPVGSCTPGEPRLLGDYGVAICYEDTDSALMRRYAKMGAKALVFITNDSWFSRSNEALAHSWQATARAVETGLNVVRVGNSGVTGTITSSGKCTWLKNGKGIEIVDKGAVMFDHISLCSGGKTWYVRLGDWPLGIMFAAMLVLLMVFKLKAESTVTLQIES